MCEPVSDEDLVARALDSGDDQAYGELVKRYKGAVCWLISRFVDDDSDGADLAQDVFTQAYFKLNQYQRNYSFKNWIMRIATNKCYDHLRKQRRRPPHLSMDILLEIGQEPSNPPEQEHPLAAQLGQALQQLSIKERLVITLLELEDHSVEMVSQLTGWSLSNVKTRAFRARTALRKLLTSGDTHG